MGKLPKVQDRPEAAADDVITGGPLIATPGLPPSGGWVCVGKVLHDGTYHRDLRIETMRRAPPPSGSAAPSWLPARLASSEWRWRLARDAATALSRRSCPPEHA